MFPAESWMKQSSLRLFDYLLGVVCGGNPNVHIERIRFVKEQVLLSHPKKVKGH